MKEIQLPETQEERQKKGRLYSRMARILSTFAVILVIVAVAALLGVFIAIVIAEFHRADAVLCYYLAGGLGGGAALCALLAFVSGKYSGEFRSAYLDFLERCDGENSFFVGDGTLATFEEGRLRLHSETSEKEILIPYADVRVFSVCSRSLPCEKGEWSVVLEVPSHYLKKEEFISKDDPPALIQTDAKERLFATLEKFGIEVLGEHRTSYMPTGKRFKPVKKYYLPDTKKRSRSLFLGGLSLVLIVAGVLVGVFYNVTLGTVLAVFGAFLLGRAVISFVGARSMFAVYQEGIYWRESERREESVFLKWSVIERVERGEHKGFPILTVHCDIGVYHFPAIGDAWEYLKLNFGEKCDA